MLKNNLVAIYCRLSKEDLNKTKEDSESESIQNQKSMLTDFSGSQGWEIFKIYVDDDYSGLDRDRPAFRQMLADASKSKFGIILCKHQSRFSRDVEIIERYLHGLFDIWGIRFISILDNVDTYSAGNKKSRQINALINQWYCEDLSDNIKAVFKRKMKEGQFLGSFAAYGYIKDPKDHHKIIVDHEASLVVKRIFELYMRGYGCAQIALILTDDKILTPSSYKRKMGLKFANPNSGVYSELYGIWSSNTVKRILQNPVYIGTLIQGHDKKVSYKSKKVITAPKDEWVIVENNHQSIIDPDLFIKVQELMQNRRTVYKPKNGNGEHATAHVLAGKVKCLDCGTNMNRSSKNRRGENYLKCRLATKTRKAECSYHSIKLENLMNTLEDKIRSMIGMYMSEQSEDAFADEYCVRGRRLNDDISVLQYEYNKISKELETAERRLTSAYKDKVDGLIDESDFISINRCLNSDKEKHLERKALIEREIDILEIKIKSLTDISSVINKYISFEVLTHEIVNDFVDYIEVGEKNAYNEQTINIHWLF